MPSSFTTDKTNYKKSWKILVIDDDRFIHVVIKESLKDFTFEGLPIQILHAYTYKEALKILSENKDIALVLLDIYLDSETTGLKLTRYIREVAGNSLVRIVIMTSSINSTLQKEAVLNYDINGYEYKDDLITKKLYTVVVASLRYYRDILHINNNSHFKIISAFGKYKGTLYKKMQLVNLK